MEWFDAVELHNMIDSAMTRIVGNCSLLIVCLMSHGSRGVLSGSCGGRVTVNDVLHQLTFCLPSVMCIPMVSLAKPCRYWHIFLIQLRACPHDVYSYLLEIPNIAYFYATQSNSDLLFIN